VRPEHNLSDDIRCRYVEINPSDAAAPGVLDEFPHQTMTKTSIAVAGMHPDAMESRDAPSPTLKLNAQNVCGDILRLCDDECNRGRATQISVELFDRKAMSGVVGHEDGALKTSKVVNITQPS
jgi:hypothetical protein